MNNAMPSTSITIRNASMLPLVVVQLSLADFYLVFNHDRFIAHAFNEFMHFLKLLDALFKLRDLCFVIHRNLPKSVHHVFTLRL